MHFAARFAKACCCKPEVLTDTPQHLSRQYFNALPSLTDRRACQYLPSCCLDIHAPSCNISSQLHITRPPLMHSLERSGVSDHDSLPRAIAWTGRLALYLLHELRDSNPELSRSAANIKSPERAPNEINMTISGTA